jgi:hypothetical protein
MFLYLTSKNVIQFFLFWKQRKTARMWIQTKNGFQHGTITFVELNFFFRWYSNCGFKLLEANSKGTDSKQQFYENENEENWKSPDCLKNVKKQKN